MTIRKTAHGWRADVDFGRNYDGRRDRRSKHCKTKREAIAAERAMVVERDARNGTLGRVRFGEFLEHVYWPQKTRLKAGTRAGYERDIRNRLAPAFGDMWLHDIGRLQIQKMLLECPTRKVAKNARDTLSSILGVAVEMGLLSVNPAGFRYEYPPASARPADADGVWLTTFAQHTPVLLHFAKYYGGQAEERLVLLGLCFGLRKSEALGLDWSDVDMTARTITVRQGYTKGKGGAELGVPKTAQSARTIPMPEYAWRRFRAWGVGEGAVVTSAKGTRMSPNTANQRMRRAVRGAFDSGRPLPRITLKSCRHSFATACINAGIDVALVSRWLGHKDISTTYNRYVRPKLDDLQAQVSTINDAMGL